MQTAANAGGFVRTTERSDRIDVSLVAETRHLAHQEETTSTQPRVGVMPVAAHPRVGVMLVAVRKVRVRLTVDGKSD